MQMTNDDIFEMVNENRIPPNFTRWALRYPSGETVAHQAAYRGILPGDFSMWGLTDASGRTVAQWAKYYGHPPECFPS